MGLNLSSTLDLTSWHGKPVAHRYRAKPIDANNSITAAVEKVQALRASLTPQFAPALV